MNLGTIGLSWVAVKFGFLTVRISSAGVRAYTATLYGRTIDEITLDKVKWIVISILARSIGECPSRSWRGTENRVSIQSI
jgi:hypothetical protein